MVPERRMSQMYLNHLQVRRTEPVRRAGGFRPGFDGSQDYDLAPRLMEATGKIVHVPKALYRRRVTPGSIIERYDEKAYAGEAANSRGKDKDDSHRGKMRRRWGPVLTSDPCFSPNVSLQWEDYRFGVDLTCLGMFGPGKA